MKQHRTTIAKTATVSPDVRCWGRFWILSTRPKFAAGSRRPALFLVSAQPVSHLALTAGCLSSLKTLLNFTHHCSLNRTVGMVKNTNEVGCNIRQGVPDASCPTGRVIDGCPVRLASCAKRITRPVSVKLLSPATSVSDLQTVSNLLQLIYYYPHSNLVPGNGL